MTTRTEQDEKLFSAKPRPHLLKDIGLVALVAALTAGFLAHAWKPGPRIDPAAVTPAVLFVQR